MKKTKALFGTDGIRGRANEFPMTIDVAMNLGRAIAYLISQGRLGHARSEGDHSRPRVILGKDTRLSGYCFEEALCAGLCSGGVDVLLLGPFPTAGVSCVTVAMRADVGVMITASHNSFEDNGIKIFGHDGFKLSRASEELLESLIEAESKSPGTALTIQLAAGEYGRAFRAEEAHGRYNAALKSVCDRGEHLEGLSIVIDAANGAAYKIAPQLFAELGAKVTVIGASPDGTNINKQCGALHIEALQKEVKAQKAHFGIALDGDADRIAVVDENSQPCLSDTLLAIFAANLKMRGKLSKNTIATTIMANMALEEWLSQSGIYVEKTDVGDRHVVERMRAKGLNLGGEPSGHFIFLDHSASADGLLAGVLLASIVKQQKISVGELKKIFTPYPQELINVDVDEKIPFEQMPTLKKALKQLESELHNVGQLLVRYSGTEPKARVLVQAPDARVAHAIASMAAEAIKKELATKNKR